LGVDNEGMSMIALALVLSAGFLHAVWNIAAKKAGGDDRFAFITAVMIAVLWAPVAVAAGLASALEWSLSTWGVVLATAFVHLLAFNTLLTSYRKADFTVVYPVARGTGPLWTSLVAVLILGESVTWLGVAGVVVVCAGIFLVAGGRDVWLRLRSHKGHHGQPDGKLIPSDRVMPGVRWGLMTGALIACYTVIDGYAIKVLLLSPIVVDYVCNVMRLPMLLPGALRDRAALQAAWRLQWRWALVVALLAPLAYVLVLYAMQRAPLSHVAPAREVSMLFAAFLGGKWLGEGDRGARMLGALCMALGVAALTFA
jgi:drug/metabolite transporter (DMT)-like permease